MSKLPKIPGHALAFGQEGDITNNAAALAAASFQNGLKPSSEKFRFGGNRTVLNAAIFRNKDQSDREMLLADEYAGNGQIISVVFDDRYVGGIHVAEIYIKLPPSDKELGERMADALRGIRYHASMELRVETMADGQVLIGKIVAVVTLAGISAGIRKVLNNSLTGAHPRPKTSELYQPQPYQEAVMKWLRKSINHNFGTLASPIYSREKAALIRESGMQSIRKASNVMREDWKPGVEVLKARAPQIPDPGVYYTPFKLRSLSLGVGHGIHLRPPTEEQIKELAETRLPDGVKNVP